MDICIYMIGKFRKTSKDIHTRNRKIGFLWRENAKNSATPWAESTCSLASTGLLGRPAILSAHLFILVFFFCFYQPRRKRL